MLNIETPIKDYTRAPEEGKYVSDPGKMHVARRVYHQLAKRPNTGELPVPGTRCPNFKKIIVVTLLYFVDWEMHSL